MEVKKMRKNLSFLQLMLLIGISLLVCNGCKKDKPGIELNVNDRWILDSMNVYYYWNDQLPQRPQDQLSATSFFKSLLNTADRFSYIESPNEIRTDYSSFAWYGFDYALIQTDAFPGRLLATVTLVVPGGPADKKGLKRGDLFTTVNGIEINTSTVESVRQSLEKGDGITIQTAMIESNTIKDKQAVSISYSRYNEQPVYMTRVFVSNSKKVGYVFYDQFNGNYDRNILDSLKKLKDQGVSELILDMRYNPGGDVSSAAKVAATLANVRAGQIFAIYQANQNGGRSNKTFQDLITENAYQPQAFSELEGRRPTLTKVIILTTGATASAAELLINGLKPFIQVIQIGEVTIGKDMASFAISDQRKPKAIDLIIHPLVFKLYNANGQGDYTAGLMPDHPVDEFSILPLKPFGDPQDPLIKKALDISGGYLTITSGLNTQLKVSQSRTLYRSIIEHNKRSLFIVAKQPF